MTTYPDTGAPEHPAFTEAFERLLLEVPATHRPKLEVWKERHGVWTFDAPHMGDYRWIACAARNFIERFNVKPEQSTDLPTLFSHWCRIIDEGGYAGTGATEQAACEDLAANREWPFLESVTEADCRLERAAIQKPTEV